MFKSGTSELLFADCILQCDSKKLENDFLLNPLSFHKNLRVLAVRPRTAGNRWKNPRKTGGQIRTPVSGSDSAAKVRNGKKEEEYCLQEIQQTESGFWSLKTSVLHSPKGRSQSSNSSPCRFSTMCFMICLRLIIPLDRHSSTEGSSLRSFWGAREKQTALFWSWVVVKGNSAGYSAAPNRAGRMTQARQKQICLADENRQAVHFCFFGSFHLFHYGFILGVDSKKQ